MRYWHPFTESAVADIKADGIDEVVVLPLYPQFSISTSGSSFRELQRLRQADAGLRPAAHALHPQLLRPSGLRRRHGRA
jgi:ferrochelatase